MRISVITVGLLTACLAGFAVQSSAQSLAQGGSVKDVSPDATPQIASVTPGQGTAGSEVSVQVTGQNFSTSAYISFSTPAVRVLSTERVDASNLRARLQINSSAQAGAVRLYVSNPASPAAETTFTILAAGAPAPAAVTGPVAETQTSAAKDPEVSSVTPAHVTRGSQAQIKVKGKRFADGARVSFSNPGIRVLGTTVVKSTELTVDVQVADDAPVGATGLFVVNPDDTEVEAPFEVTEAAGSAPGGAKTGAVKTATTGKVQAPQNFEVFNLGEGISILQNPAKSKGTLTLTGNKLTYNEEGKEVFSAAAAEVKEIEVNSVLGVNTGTFHIMLNSGKTYNFIAASLRPPDSEAMVSTLQSALH